MPWTGNPLSRLRNFNISLHYSLLVFANSECKIGESDNERCCYEKVVRDCGASCHWLGKSGICSEVRARPDSPGVAARDEASFWGSKGKGRPQTLLHQLCGPGKQQRRYRSFSRSPALQRQRSLPPPGY